MSTSTYLSAKELADLITCAPNSYACMRRWLEKNGWPYSKNRRGFPQVFRVYHDARMTGQPMAAMNDAMVEPDFGALTKTA